MNFHFSLGIWYYLIIIGGKVHSIEVNYDEGGKTEMSGGVQCCVLPAGNFYSIRKSI